MSNEVELKHQLEEALQAQKQAENSAQAAKEIIRELEAQVKKLQTAASQSNDDFLSGKRKKILESVVYDAAEVGLPIPLSVDILVDSFLTLYTETKIQSIRNTKPTVSNFIERYEPVAQHLRSVQQTKDDYNIIKLIGKGSFAEIFLAKKKSTGRVCVIKQMPKLDLMARAMSVCFRNELDFLILAANSSLHNGQRAPGITSLQSAFHDRTNVYLVMDFYPGGDLLGLLSKREQFSEEMARFYIAELVLAIDTVHKLGYVHRDIKIDNLLLDNKGHLVLADFGSCCPLNEDEEVDTYLSGGTPDYISPELLAAIEGDEEAVYGCDCDWWSLGVVMYEMLVGETPFYADSVLDIYKNIKNYKTSLHFPNDIPLSDHAKDLIRRLCTDRDKRIGSLGVEEIMEHPFFMDISWNKLRKSRTPFVPELASATDTAFFEDFDEDEEEGSSHILEPLSRKSSTFNGGISSEFGNYLPFSGYIFNKEDEEPSTAQKKFRGVVSLLQGQPQLIQQIMGSPTPGSPLLSRNLANLRSPMSSPMLGPSSSSESFSLSPKGSSSSLFLPPTLGAVSNTPSSLSAAVTVATSPSSSSSSLATPATAQGASTIYNAGTNTTVSTGISPDLTLTSSNASLNDSTAPIASAASADNQAPSPSPPLPSPKQVTSSPIAIPSQDRQVYNDSASDTFDDVESEPKGRRVKFSDISVFMDASKNGDLGAVRRFIESGKLTATSITEMEQTALHAAAAGGQIAVADYLLSQGAAINAVDYNLTTPLHCAAFEDEMEMVKYLIDKGADVEATNADDEKPVDVAGDDDVVAYIASRMSSDS